MQISQVASAPGFGLGALQKTNRSLEKILERLATSQRINRASDDAAGLGVSEQLRTQIRGFKMASQNVTDAMSSLDIADGTSSEVADMLQRQRELAIQSKNDTLNSDQRGILNKEYQQISQEMNRISQGAQFNSPNVAAGSGLASGAAVVQAGPNAGDQVTLPQVNMSADALGITATSILDQNLASFAVDSIDNAMKSLNSQRSTIGATTNSMESIQNNLQVATSNTQAAESMLRDQEMAQGITEMTTLRLLEEGGNRAFARFQEISANHLMALLK